VRAAQQARRERREAVADPGRHGKRTFLESQLPRIVCGEHGKITAAVPSVRRDDRFSRPFEEFATWKAAYMLWTRAAAELRMTWEALASITGRVAADATADTDRLDGLRRIGMDEKSWGKGAGKYLVIVSENDAGRVAWVAEVRDQATIRAFFDALGPDRTESRKHVSADGARGDTGKTLMRCVTARTHRCRIPEMTSLARTLSRFKASIEATLHSGSSNGRAEVLNALITRGRGFRRATALMNMITFVHGSLCPNHPTNEPSADT
jgi:transposase